MNPSSFHLLRWSLAALIGALLMSACSPMTPVRRSLYAPRPTLPARIGAPLDTGELRAFGQINSLSLVDLEGEGEFWSTSRVGEPGVLTPRLQVGAGAYLGLSEFLEVGGQFSYSQMQWTRANTAGVLPFPESEGRHLIIGGLGARLNAPLPEGFFTISFVGELNMGALPQAYFECIHEACRDSRRTSLSAEEDTAYYRLDRVGYEQVFLPQGALHFTFQPIHGIAVFALMGAQVNYRNIGFDANPDSLNDPTLQSYFVSTLGAGIDLQFKPLTMTMATFFPVHNDSRIPVGPSAVMQAGLSF